MVSGYGLNVTDFLVVAQQAFTLETWVQVPLEAIFFSFNNF